MINLHTKYLICPEVVVDYEGCALTRTMFQIEDYGKWKLERCCSFLNLVR